MIANLKPSPKIHWVPNVKEFDKKEHSVTAIYLFTFFD